MPLQDTPESAPESYSETATFDSSFSEVSQKLLQTNPKQASVTTLNTRIEPNHFRFQNAKNQKKQNINCNISFRWNPFTTSYAGDTGDTDHIWSLMYGSKPKSIFNSDIYGELRRNCDLLLLTMKNPNIVLFSKEAQQALGYNIRAGLLDYIPPFFLGRLLDQAGRRISVLLISKNTLVKVVVIPLMLPFYIIAKSINILKGLSAVALTGALTVMSVLFFAFRGNRTINNKPLQADHSTTTMSGAEILSDTAFLRNQLGTIRATSLSSDQTTGRRHNSVESIINMQQNSSSISYMP